MASDRPDHTPQRYQREQAVALQYDGNDLPRIVSSGVGEVARQIIALAREHNIPIHEDAVLTGMLAELNTGSVISPESFKLVAEVICFLYHTDKAWREKHPVVAEKIEKP